MTDADAKREEREREREREREIESAEKFLEQLVEREN